MSFGNSSIFTILIMLVMSCSPSKDQIRLQNELAEKTSELIRVQTERDALRQQLDTLKQKTSEQSPNIETAGRVRKLDNPLVAMDRVGAVQVTLLSVLTENEALSAGRTWEHIGESFRKQGKYLVYYEVMVKNIRFQGEFNVSHYDFKLEDDKGNTYACEQTCDYITGKIHPDRSTRGGISFALYADAQPKKLIYNTGVEIDGLSLEVVFDLPTH